jgi:probable rRNA maturation factor
VRAALRPYGVTKDAQLILAFVDDSTMRELNRRYRQKDRTTDVLSFGQSLRRGAKGASAARALQREADGTLELGDVVISGAQATRQAKRRRWPIATEVAFLAAHGALHLLGYDDDTSSGYREMLRLGHEALKGQRTGGR